MSVPDSGIVHEYFYHMKRTNPSSWDVFASETESSFHDAAAQAVQHVVIDIESGSKLYFKSEERQLTHLMSKMLFASGIPTTSEEFHDGHVDVLIKHPRTSEFYMLGECKIYGGPKYHTDGCEQLLGYSSGRSARAFMLEFIKQPDAYDKMASLRTYFDSNKPLRQLSQSVEHTFKGSFVTHHKHRTASVVEVLHMCCNLWPSDGDEKASAEPVLPEANHSRPDDAGAGVVASEP